MEGIEYQLRPSNNIPGTHPAVAGPFTLLRRLAIGEAYLSDLERLQNTLQDIQTQHSIPRLGPPHTGSKSCPRCMERDRRIIDAYHAFYLSPLSNRWHSHQHEYRIELQNMFDQPHPDMKAIAERAERESRAWLRGDVCAPDDDDTDDFLTLKKATAMEFEGTQPTYEILITFLKELENMFSQSNNGEAARLLSSLQNTKALEERIPVFLDYYGLDYQTGSSTSTIGRENPTSPVLKSFKAKYRGMFEQGVAHEVVEEEMKTDIGFKREQEVSGLRKKLAGLELARSAAEKERVRREERAKEKKGLEANREAEVLRCAMKGCDMIVDANIEGGPVECAVCDWLAARGAQTDSGRARRREIYCSVEHGEADSEHHDKSAHKCIMRDHCFYNPMAGPPGETGAGGICPDCADRDRASYFCSQACYSHNLTHHRKMYHEEREIENLAEVLDRFIPADGMVVEPKP